MSVCAVHHCGLDHGQRAVYDDLFSAVAMLAAIPEIWREEERKKTNCYACKHFHISYFV